MARNRMIKPSFWEDEKVQTLSRDARLLFVATWTHSDDLGVCRAHPVFLKNNAFPYDVDITPLKVTEWLEEIAAKGLIILGEYNGEKYLKVKNFLKHQIIDRPSKTYNIPSERLKEVFGEYSESTRRVLEDEEKRSEVKLSENINPLPQQAGDVKKIPKNSRAHGTNPRAMAKKKQELEGLIVRLEDKNSHFQDIERAKFLLTSMSRGKKSDADMRLIAEIQYFHNFSPQEFENLQDAEKDSERYSVFYDQVKQDVEKAREICRSG